MNMQIHSFGRVVLSAPQKVINLPRNNYNLNCIRDHLAQTDIKTDTQTSCYFYIRLWFLLWSKKLWMQELSWFVAEGKMLLKQFLLFQIIIIYIKQEGLIFVCLYQGYQETRQWIYILNYKKKITPSKD